MADPTVARAAVSPARPPVSKPSVQKSEAGKPAPAPAKAAPAPAPASWRDSFDAHPRPMALANALSVGEIAAYAFRLPDISFPKSINLPNPWHIFGKNDREKLIDSTKDLRETAAQGRSIQAQLDRTPKSDPNHAKLQQQLASVDRKLSSKYGYTTATAPKPGTMFLDPQFQGAQLPAGR